MKKLLIVIMIISVIVGVVLIKDNKNEDVIRIHIRAHSDATVDSEISTLVRNNVIGYLSDKLISCNDKNEAFKLIKSELNAVNNIIDKILVQNNISYTARIMLREEDMPLRQYMGYTLDRGVYDSLTIELGDASGEDWWCVAYPPICFNDDKDYHFKSRLEELIKKYMPK